MFRRLRWLTILVPALTVGAIELLGDSLLDEIGRASCRERV